MQLNRDDEQRDATKTFITAHAVFETISPREGGILRPDHFALFEWTLRDDDGNTVDGAETVNGISMSPCRVRMQTSTYTRRLP